MVNELGTTNSLIVVFIFAIAVAGFFAFVYLRTSTGRTAPNAVFVQFIGEVGRLATSVDTLGKQQFDLNKQLISESTKGIEQREKLIDVLTANQTVLVAMDGNLTLMGKGLETTRNQTDLYYNQLHQKLLDIVAFDTITKGELDVMRRFDDKLNLDIEAIKQELGEIKKLLTERAEMDTTEKKKLTDALNKMQSEITQLAVTMKGDTGEHPAVDTPPETKVEPPQE